MSEIDNEEPRIEPVTNLQKQWRVLTFHEDRLNKLDMHLKERFEGGVSETGGHDMLSEEINRLSLAQDEFISTHVEKVNTIEKNIHSRIDAINDKINSSIKDLRVRLDNLG